MCVVIFVGQQEYVKVGYQVNYNGQIVKWIGLCILGSMFGSIELELSKKICNNQNGCNGVFDDIIFVGGVVFGMFDFVVYLVLVVVVVWLLEGRSGMLGGI